jgi:hypothetical protein
LGKSGPRLNPWPLSGWTPDRLFKGKWFQSWRLWVQVTGLVLAIMLPALLNTAAQILRSYGNYIEATSKTRARIISGQ